MKLKPFAFGLGAMLALAFGIQQPVFAAKQAKDLSFFTSSQKEKTAQVGAVHKRSQET